MIIKHPTKKFKMFIKEINCIYFWDIYEDFKRNSMYYESNLIKDNQPLNLDLNFSPQQFTGFYDKNNVEIYEGDYVKFNDNNCIVEFEKGSFVLKFINSKKKIWFHNIKKSDILENMGMINF